MLFISEKVLSLQPNLLVSSSIYDIYVLGLTGFDGEMKWYISTRRLVGYLLNLSEQKLIGERNYALAA